MRYARGQLVFILAAALLPAAGCLPKRATINAWVAGEMTNLTHRTPRFDDRVIYSPRAATVGLFSAANETVSFQLVIDGEAAVRSGGRAVRIKFSKLSGPRGSKISGSAFSA